MQGLIDHSNSAGFFRLLMPCGDGTAEIFDLDMAAAWLVWEANRRPASEVVVDFAYFLDHREVEGLKVELIHGLQIESSIDLGASLRLETFATLPASWQKNVFAQRGEFERYDFRRLGDPVALTIRFPISPGLANPGDQSTFDKHKREDAERQLLMDAIPPLLTLLGHGAPVASGSWSQVTGRGVPALGSPALATGFENLGAMAYRPPIQIDPVKAQTLVGQFLELPQISRTRLGVPLRHLNRSRRQYTAEDAATDLRTALEALLVPDAGQEITFKVSLLGAWMLGNDHEERKRAYYRLKKAYGMGSQAVHGGKIKGNKVMDLIQEVQSDAVTILKTVIEAGDKIIPLEVALGRPLHGSLI